MEKDKDIIIIITDDNNDHKEISPSENYATEVHPNIPYGIHDIADNPGAVGGNEQATVKVSGVDTNNDDKKRLNDKVSEKKDALRRRIYGYFKSLPNNLTRRFIIISVCVCAAIVIAVGCTAYFIPKNNTAVSNGRERLLQKDSAYIEAKNKYDDAAAEKNNLSSELEEKEKKLDELHGAQSNLDKITEKNAELEQTRDKLKKEAADKQKELDTLASIQQKNSEKVTSLSSGYYTVGKDLTEGTYTISGTGSIAIANSGKSIANKSLTAEGEAFTLRADDIVQIDGSAKLTPQ